MWEDRLVYFGPDDQISVSLGISELLEARVYLSLS